ncbi:MAG: hypothetical protein KC635_10590 [Myxococcales bacterium]|nr:hypothetical protein [Myxococcales bacterium]
MQEESAPHDELAHDAAPEVYPEVYRFRGSLRLAAGAAPAFDRLVARDPTLGQLLTRRFRTVRVAPRAFTLGADAWERTRAGLLRAAGLAGAGEVRVRCDAFDARILATGRHARPGAGR